MSGGGDWKPELRPCPCCGSDRFRTLGRRGGRAHRAGLGVETGIVRCRSCHAVYPRPALIPLHNPYERYSSAEYFHSHETKARRAYGRAIATEALRRLGRTGDMLELGCGWGDLLRGASEVGWRVSGVEMTASFIRPEGDLAVEIAPVERAQSLDQPHDVIILSAILEHLYDPVACLHRVKRALRPGGLVFIDVPNECSLWTRLGNAYMWFRGRDWSVNLSPTFPPFHVVGFCPRSLASLIRRRGLDVSDLQTHAWDNNLPEARTGLERMERMGADLTLGLGAMIGMGAGITCWARNPA